MTTKNEKLIYEDSGAQIVEVNHRYAYLWRGSEPLAVGDRVEAPGTPFSGFEPWIGTVTNLGSDYLGAMSTLLRKLSNT
jgi:hypothetical protein